MKSIFLSVVIISALVISGLGGTLATWSDAETSIDNTISTGSVDLLVWDEDNKAYADDLPWGTGVGAKVNIVDMIPCSWYGPYPVTLKEFGQHPDPLPAWIHIKKLVCGNVLPKEGSGYADPSTGESYSGDMKPEPELVAEYGGKVNCVTVPGIGVSGDDCSMGTGVTMNINSDPSGPTAGRVYYTDLLGKYVCNEKYLFDLTPCTSQTIYLWFKLSQAREEDAGYDFIPDPPWDQETDLAGNNFGYDDDYYQNCLHWQKFNDWVSWVYMKDKATFDMEFSVSLLNHAGTIPPPPPPID